MEKHLEILLENGRTAGEIPSGNFRTNFGELLETLGLSDFSADHNFQGMFWKTFCRGSREVLKEHQGKSSKKYLEKFLNVSPEKLSNEFIEELPSEL